MSLLVPLCLACAASLAIEAVAGGNRAGISVSPRAMTIRLVGYLVVAAFWFQFSWRPWLAAASCVLTVAALTLVSHLKRGIIGEPLVFSDFVLLRQVPRHPELYYTRPLHDPRVAGPLVTALGLVALWYWLEPAVLPSGFVQATIAAITLPGALAGVAWAASRIPAALRATLFPRPDLDADVRRYGQPATLLGYWLRWHGRAPRSACLDLQPPDPADIPEIVVVVQLESFVDPERIGGPPLPVMDLFRSRASQYGRLRVPAHGAYTMRTEHAVLTGCTQAELGFSVYDPYLSFGGREDQTLPRRAAAAGYRTLFVHPFHRDFFARAAVVTALGFERLVMEEDFGGASRVGPYVGDEALAERILQEALADDTPVFLYAVTMENHGPWKPGRLPGIDVPLAQYIYHVSNTGRMVERLVAGLEGRNALLCVFGDHAPALPECRPGFGDTSTDYALFRFGREPARRRVDLTADALGRTLQAAIPSAGRPPCKAAPPS